MDINLKNEEESQGETHDSLKDEVGQESNTSQEISEKEDTIEDEDLDVDVETDTTDQSEEKEKSNLSFFKRNKKTKQDDQNEKIEELTDKLMRKAAEFDNFRKRSEKEKSQMFDIGAKSVVESILPVIDSFERGLGLVKEEEKEDPFVQGVEQVYKQLLKSLEDIGVKPIEALSKEFDPNFHNAVMHEDDPEQGENIIIEEFQKGYIYKDNVVRYSMVKVVN